jgi:ribosomal-protein-alanine N-acetyltransferase
MTEIVMRAMQEQDIPAIIKIERISFSTPWSEAAFFSEIHKSYSLARVAVSGDTIVGYICVDYILNECHIMNLAVHPDFRRQGIATILLEEVMKELRKKGCRFFYLEVRFSNTGARAFYERFSFRIVGIRKKYYTSPNEDAALMMLRI